MKFLFLSSLIAIALADGNTKLPVSPQSFPLDIRTSDLFNALQTLEGFAYSYPERNRVYGGEAHIDTILYIVNELRATNYYDIYLQPQKHLWVSENQTLTVGNHPIMAEPISKSPSVNVSAPVAVVLNYGCNKEDYPSYIAGKIALVERGGCKLEMKSILAAEANAGATIIYNNRDGLIEGGLNLTTSEMGRYSAMVGISKKDGERLAYQATNGCIGAHVWVENKYEMRMTHNIIAQTKSGDPNNVIILGSHSDSVNEGPGINDDGSGIVSNLVIATALSKYSVKNAVRFCFWTAEEYGLLGSNFYVESLNTTELDKIRLYLNFDLLASPNYALMIYDGDGSAFNKSGPPGSEQIKQLFQQYFISQNLPYSPAPLEGRSDYVAFVKSGIPIGGLTTGSNASKTDKQVQQFGGYSGVPYDYHYHSKHDDILNVDHNAHLINSRATAFVVATYANNLTSIPPRSPSTLHPRSIKGRHRNNMSKSATSRPNLF